jgi:hypothetical protein
VLARGDEALASTIWWSRSPEEQKAGALSRSSTLHQAGDLSIFGWFHLSLQFEGDRVSRSPSREKGAAATLSKPPLEGSGLSALEGLGVISLPG